MTVRIAATSVMFAILLALAPSWAYGSGPGGSGSTGGSGASGGAQGTGQVRALRGREVRVRGQRLRLPAPARRVAGGGGALAGLTFGTVGQKMNCNVQYIISNACRLQPLPEARRAASGARMDRLRSRHWRHVGDGHIGVGDGNDPQRAERHAVGADLAIGEHDEGVTVDGNLRTEPGCMF